MSLPGRMLLILFTSASLALAIVLALAGLPLLFLAIAVPLIYVVSLVVGVMVPQLQMFAYSRSRAFSGRAEIALTFDDGPDPSTTPSILSILAAAGERATFFVLGAKAREAPQVLRAIAAAGHEIGIHGHTHDRFLSVRRPASIVDSVARAQAAVEAVTGHRPTLFRPPLGHVSPRTAKAAEAARLTLVAWSVRSRDGRASTSAEEVARRVLTHLRPGDIVLMHDAAEHGNRAPASIAALPGILEEIRRRGLRCVTVSRLLERTDTLPTAP
jgi:peptidoglycan/xylan/chitin deacetylase (PgdA/CDA1 family)